MFFKRKRKYYFYSPKLNKVFAIKAETEADAVWKFLAKGRPNPSLKFGEWRIVRK